MDPSLCPVEPTAQETSPNPSAAQLGPVTPPPAAFPFPLVFLGALRGEARWKVTPALTLVNSHLRLLAPVGGAGRAERGSAGTRGSERAPGSQKRSNNGKITTAPGLSPHGPGGGCRQGCRRAHAPSHEVERRWTSLAFRSGTRQQRPRPLPDVD